MHSTPTFIWNMHDKCHVEVVYVLATSLEFCRGVACACMLLWGFHNPGNVLPQGNTLVCRSCFGVFERKIVRLTSTSAAQGRLSKGSGAVGSSPDPLLGSVVLWTYLGPTCSLVFDDRFAR
ncbi:unnamed protein product [Discosporangium mesarthrocarpum]